VPLKYRQILGTIGIALRQETLSDHDTAQAERLLTGNRFRTIRNAMKARLGMPKYSRVWSLLCAAALALILLSREVGHAAPPWLSTMGGVLLAASLIVNLAGLIAQRREAEAKHSDGAKAEPPI
jgi:hypothetical protein